MRTRTKLALATLGGLTLVGLGIQFLPTGVAANPPVVQEPDWDSPRTRELAVRAGCTDCHSNETVWPWYSHVAPVSWLVAEHVADGRAHLNVSEMHLTQKNADEASEEVRDGEMPPRYYLLLHSGAALSESETEELAAGLEATFGREDHGSSGADRTD